MTGEPSELVGGCLCGAVRFRIESPFRRVIVCHCRQCARWSGHVLAATAVASERFQFFSGEGDVTWYRSSDEADRGFCSRCGSSLFWRKTTLDHLSIAAGSLDQPTGLEIAAHIYVDDKADYCERPGDAPCFAAGSGGAQNLATSDDEETG